MLYASIVGSSPLDPERHVATHILLPLATWFSFSLNSTSIEDLIHMLDSSVY